MMFSGKIGDWIEIYLVQEANEIPSRCIDVSLCKVILSDLISIYALENKGDHILTVNFHFKRIDTV